MKLSDLKIGEIIKDSVFDWLGLTAEEYEGRKVLTFLNDEKYIEEVIKNKSVISILPTKKLQHSFSFRQNSLSDHLTVC